MESVRVFANFSPVVSLPLRTSRFPPKRSVNPGGPMSLGASGKGQVEGGRRVTAREIKRFFPLSTSRFPQQKREALATDGVREVGDSPEFSVRYGRAK